MLLSPLAAHLLTAAINVIAMGDAVPYLWYWQERQTVGGRYSCCRISLPMGVHNVTLPLTCRCVPVISILNVALNEPRAANFLSSSSDAPDKAQRK